MTLLLANPFEVNRLNDSSDFRPAWDVLSINASVSEEINRAIASLRARAALEPGRKIIVVLGAAGHGKTHVFGRIQHQQAQQISCVFVPQVIDARRPAAHIQWHLIEHLFQEAPAPHSRLAQLLARLLQPAFADYFDRLPAQLASRHESLRQRLEEDPLAVLEIVAPVRELAPFHRLADSVVSAFHELPADIVRALVLALSPAANDARRWLRGEGIADSLAPELQLAEDSPQPANVLRTVCVLLGRLQLPVVLCIDQLEGFLVDPEGPREVAKELMGWLQSVPNLLMVVSCLDSEWSRFVTFESLKDRVAIVKLQPINGTQAVELVRRRLKDWDGAQPERGELWPFKDGSIEQYVNKKPLPPRGFLKVCNEHFGLWLEKRSQDGPIQIGGVEGPSLEEAFLQEWNRTLEMIQKAVLTPDNLQEERLFEGVREALQTAIDGKVRIDDALILSLQKDAVRKVKDRSPPSAEVRFGVGERVFRVVVAATKLDGGVAFGAYFTALEEAMGGDVLGAVLVRPHLPLTVGKAAQVRKNYEKAVNQGKLRPFPLDGEQLDFHHLECLLQLVQKAGSGDLQLVGRPLSVKECRQIVIRLKLLDNLKLFKTIAAEWPAVEAARPRSVESAQEKVATTTPAGAGQNSPPESLKAGPKSPPPVDSPEAKAKAVTGTTVSPQSPKGGTPQEWAQGLLVKVTEKLRLWGQPVKPQGFEVGPTFVRLKLTPQDQTDVNKVRRKAENLGLHLELPAPPLIASQAGYISIDVQRPDRQTVALGSLLAARPEKLRGQPAFPVGVDVSGQAHWLNLADPATCHVLIAGTTGSGKSEFMKAMLAALAHGLPPDQLQLVLIDPKQVTFNLTGESPYLSKPVAHDTKDALPLVEEAFDEMEKRYTLLKQRRKENISELTGRDSQPRLVLVLDEFGDLMLEKNSKKELETLLKRLGAKARAAGIHLVLGTQRTEASVVTPLLRANLPGRISLKVAGERDSKLILDAPEAAGLLGRGDLFWKQGAGLIRLQSPFIDRDELEKMLRV